MKATTNAGDVYLRSLSAAAAIRTDMDEAIKRLAQLQVSLDDSIKQDSKTTTIDHERMLSGKTIIQKSMTYAARTLAVVDKISSKTRGLAVDAKIELSDDELDVLSHSSRAETDDKGRV